MSRKLISVAQLQECWGVSKPTIYGLISRSHDPLPAFNVGAIRIDPAEAEAWLERQRANA